MCTVIFSDSPATPGRRQHSVRTSRRISTPAPTGLVERVDDRRVGEAVDLHVDAPARTAVALEVDEFDDPRPGRVGLTMIIGTSSIAREAREEIEQLADVVGDVRVAGQQSEVLVDARGLAVVVARRDWT